MVDKDFIITQQASVVVEGMKYKQSALLQNLYSTPYKNL